MENKQTAVNWMANELLYFDNEFDMKLIDKNEYQKKRKEILEQAKAMEKEQIMDAYTADCDTLGHTNAFKVAAEQYYNETYSSGRTESVKSE